MVISFLSGLFRDDSVQGIVDSGHLIGHRIHPHIQRSQLIVDSDQLIVIEVILTFNEVYYR